MDLKQIQELIKIIDESKLTTFELEEEGLKIVLKKEKEKVITQELPPTPAVVSPIPQDKQAVGAENPAETAMNRPTINSPIVGTYYASSSPGAEPFVRPGSMVKKGETLCIIEAMKLMNEIEAEDDIQIIEILVQDGQMVEYGQPLFIIA